MVEQVPSQQQQQSYAQYLNKQGSTWESEKTFTDKLLGRQEMDELRSLIQKDDLTREDFSSILNLLSGINSKLVNYNEWDRYIVCKFFTWIREFVKSSMHTIACLDTINKYLIIIDQELEKEKDKDRIDKLNELKNIFINAKNALTECRNSKCDNAKFLFDVFMIMSNTTLSINAAAFDALSTSKFEYAYPQGNPFVQIPVVQPDTQRRGVFGFLKRR